MVSGQWAVVVGSFLPAFPASKRGNDFSMVENVVISTAQILFMLAMLAD